MSLLKKKGLLLTHGTIYGSTLTPVMVAVQLTGFTHSVEQYNYPGFDWDADVPYLGTLPAAPFGPTTDNAPVDMVHWSTAGNMALSPMAHWRSCMKFLRHI